MSTTKKGINTFQMSKKLFRNRLTVIFNLTCTPFLLQGRTVMHTAAECGSCKVCEVILNLRLDAVYDTDKKVHIYSLVLYL